MASCGLIASNSAESQISDASLWVWLKGDTLFNTSAIHGTKGVASATNTPGSRVAGITWRDDSSNLWLFGGLGRKGSIQGPMNDMWKYNITTNQWMWVAGDSIVRANGVYGQMGVSSDSIKPGARMNSSAWKDGAGKFWLFGGDGMVETGIAPVSLADLWRYDPATNQWTWISGLKVGNINGYYGAQGVAATYNRIGGRSNAVGWADVTGNFWIFGGWGYPENGSAGRLNDLWKFETSTKLWTWMKGDNSISAYGVYGTQGGGAGTNKPGARHHASGWADPNGNLWMFGGYGYAFASSGMLNDLWKYNISTNQWTWVKGDNATSINGVYGTKGVASNSNKPGSRYRQSSWTDINGNFWLYGGTGFANSYGGDLSDLWKYNPAANQWTWVKGDSTRYDMPVFGTMGLPSTTNKPGIRLGSMTWTDMNGNFWLYGGEAPNPISDMWRLSNSYVFTGNGLWNNSTNWQNNLVAPTNVPAGTEVFINPSGQCSQPGNLSTQIGGKIQILPSKALLLGGDLNNAGAIEGNGILTFATGTSTLTSTGTLTTTLILSAKKLVLNSDLNTGTIIMAGNSRLTLGDFNLSINTFDLIGDTSNFVVTNGTGKVRKHIGSSPVDLFIGADSISCTPVKITNTGTPSDYNVRVSNGVSSRTANTMGHVNRTWHINAAIVGTRSKITVQWNQVDEQLGFNRNNAYIAQSHSCPLPPNCVDSYYDVQARSAAAGSGPFTLSRDSVINPTSFKVKSSSDVSTFTGNGSWNDPNNWTIGIVPPSVLENGREIIINHPAGGQCTVTGNLTIKKGAKLTVLPGKKLQVTGKIIVDNSE
jgi:hypothetical protein